MEPTSREPIYNTDKTARIVSGPNGTWRWELQKGDATKTFSGWVPEYSFVPDFNRAQAKLLASNKAIAEASKK